MSESPAATSASAESESYEVRLNRLLLTTPGLTVATAESCTGGAVAHRITTVAGSSGYFLGGIVAYANEAKERLLGVSREILRQRGAVSAECALAMAEGARRAFNADIAVSTTGIAGPGGATARKPVGLVYIAFASPLGTGCEEHHFSGDRLAVIHASTEAALRLLVEQVTRNLLGKAD
ncbi:MAG TPA: CinA family protein [Thermomicrobiales bacterium]